METAMKTFTRMERLEALLLGTASPTFLIFNDAQKLDELRDELVTLTEQAKNLQAKADGEKRALTEDEEKEINTIFARFDAVESEIERREQIVANEARLAKPSGRKTEPDDVANAERGNDPATRRTRVAAQPRDGGDVARHGFRSFGEFAQAVKNGAAQGGSLDPRLVANAPTTTSTEGVGADGGFAVPPEFRTAIYQKVMAEDGLLSRTDQLTSSSNSITLPKDETTAWQTSGGILPTWEGEGSQLSQSKVALEQSTIRLNKLTALVPVTEELLADASSLATYINRKVPEKFAFKINDAIVNGTGAGQPKGILTADSLVTVSKESGQAADTLVFQNVVNMYSRVYSGCRANMVWLINQDIEPQLYSMAFPGTGTAVPVYLPPGGLSASPYGTLMGRPVIPTQACDTLGDVGDIIAVDLSKYMTAMKTGGIRSDVSMHLWFDYDTTAFRFIMRLAGQPWWTAAITPKNSAATLSWAVALEAR
jgi:HK97 family phage major capsid protein